MVKLRLQLVSGPGGDPRRHSVVRIYLDLHPSPGFDGGRMISDAGALLSGATLIAELGWYHADLACCPPLIS